MPVCQQLEIGNFHFNRPLIVIMRSVNEKMCSFFLLLRLLELSFAFFPLDGVNTELEQFCLENDKFLKYFHLMTNEMDFHFFEMTQWMNLQSYHEISLVRTKRFLRVKLRLITLNKLMNSEKEKSHNRYYGNMQIEIRLFAVRI